MAKCDACGTRGGLGNSVWLCRICDKELCLRCMERSGQKRGGFIGMGESFKCPKCSADMKKVAW